MAKSSKESQTKDKEKSLQSALSQIETQFGPGTIMRMGDREVQNIPSISTGSLGLDVALGIGGLPKGRVVEIFGPESSGKTTLARRAPAGGATFQRPARGSVANTWSLSPSSTESLHASPTPKCCPRPIASVLRSRISGVTPLRGAGQTPR